MPVTTTLVLALDGSAVVGSVTGPHHDGQWIARERTTGTRHRAASYDDACAVLRAAHEQQGTDPASTRRRHPTARKQP